MWKQSVRRQQRAQRRRRRDRITPYLSGAFLEERQVLDGMPIMVSELTGAVELNSGTAADDGVADVYQAQVVQHDGQDRLQVTVNGQVAYSGLLGSAASITIRGSSDADVLVVYGSQEHPEAWHGLTFDAGGGDDRLVLVDWSAQSVQHTLTGNGVGQLSVVARDREAVLSYRGVESIADSIDANIRDFQFLGDGDRIGLSDDGWEDNGISRLSGDAWPEVTFASPGDRLRIDTTSASATRIDVSGLDASFDADLEWTASASSRVRLERELTLGSGNLRVQAGEIEVSGTVRTNEAAIELAATSRIHLESGSSMQNDGGRVTILGGEIQHDGSLTARGGEVTMHARGGTLIVSGTVDVSDSTPGQSGGTVHLFGDRVGLLDAARIDASGAVGGGCVLIGGDYQGANPDIPNALRTYVGTEVHIAADALDAGDGGTVVVWADEATWFYGRISARGGEQGGNGGFAEVSGKQFLDYRGQVDTRAPLGRVGTLLLDPTNVRIVVAGGESSDLTEVDEFSDPDIPPDDDVTLDVAAINSATSNVVIQANNDIIVEAAAIINIADAGINLTMQAGRSIIVNANITTNNGAVTLTANETVANGVQDVDRAPGAAVVTMAAGTTIDAGDQDITIRVSTGPNTNNTSGDITLGDLTTSGHVLVVNDGPTAGSGIVRATPLSSITAASVALDVNGAGGGGEIGESDSPIRVDVSYIEARGQSAGIFIESLNVGVTTIGGAALGGLTGISTSPGGHIELSATLGTEIMVSEAVSADGSGNVTLNAGAGVLNIVAAVSSGSGNIRLTSDDIAVNDTIGSSGELVLQPTTTTRSIGINDAGDYHLTAAEIGNLLEGFSNIRIGRTDGTHAIAVGAASFRDSIVLSAPQPGGSIAVNGQLDTLASTDSAAITLDGPGATTTLNADIVTAGGAILISDSVVLAGGGSYLLDTTNGGAVVTGASITIEGTLDATTAGVEDLSLRAGTDGNVDLQGAVGDGVRLGDLTVVSANDVSLPAVTAGRLLQQSGAGTTTFLGAVDLDNGAAGDILKLDDVNAVTFDNAATVTTASEGNVRLDGDTTGVLTIGTGAFLLDGSFQETDFTLLGLAANIVTSGDNISFADPVELNGDVSLSTGAAGGDIALAGTVDSDGTSRQLSFTAGTGDITVNGPLGGTAALQSVTIHSARHVTFSGTVRTSGDFTQAAGTGTTTLNGTSGTGIGGMLSLTTDAIAFNTATVDTVGAVQLQAQNAVTLNAGLNAGSSTIAIAANQDGAGAEGFSQTAGTIQTTNASASAVAIDVNAAGGGAGSAALGDISSGSGGTITVSTATGGNASGGSITQTALTLLNAGTGTVALSTPTTGASGIGTAADNIRTTAGTVTATTGSAGVFITETDGAGFTATATGAGDVRLTNIAGTLNVAGATTTGSGAIVLSSGDAITLNAAVGGVGFSGTVTINANTDNAGSQSFTQNSGGSIQTANETANSVSITVGGTGGAALRTITVGTTVGRVTMNVGGTITDAANNTDVNVTALELLITASNGVGTSGNPLETEVSRLEAFGGAGGVFVDNTGGLTIGGIDAGVTGVSSTSGSIHVTASSLLTVNERVESTGGGTITLAATNNSDDTDDLVLNAQVITSGGHGNIVLEAGHDLTVNNSVAQDVSVTGNGTITANAANVTTLAANVQLATGGGAATSITLSTDDLVINEAAAIVLNAGAGAVTIRNSSQDRRINLGTLTAATDDLDLSNTELNRITAGKLIVGRNDSPNQAGNVTIDGAVSTSTSLLHIMTGGSVTDTSGAGSISETSLAIQAAGAVTLTNSANDVTNLAINVVSGDIRFTDASGLVIATVDGVDGIQTDSGSIHLVLIDGSLTVDRLIQANGIGQDVTIDVHGAGDDDDVVLNANIEAPDQIDIRASRDIMQPDADRFLIADNLTLVAGRNIGEGASLATRIDTQVTTLAAQAGTATDGSMFINQDALGGALTIGELTSAITASTITGATIGSGATDGGIDIRTEAGSMTISHFVTAKGTGNVILSAAGATSDMTLDATVTAGATGGDAHLRAGQDLLQASDSVFVVADQLALEAGRAIGTAAGSNAIDLRVNTVAAESGLAADSANIFLNEDAAGGELTIGQVTNLIDGGSVTGVTVGAAATSGSIDVRAEAGSLTVSNVVTAKGTGNVILDAAGAASDMTLDAAVTAGATGGDAHLRAGQDILQTSDSVFVVADQLALQAGRVIGTATGADAIDLQVNTVAAESGRATDGGHIFLNEDAAGVDLVVGQVTNLIDGGDVTGVTVSGDPSNADVHIRIEAGSLTVASLIKAGATSGDVTLEAATGEITNPAGNDATIVASGLSMIADQGIGNGELLRIDVVTVAATTTQGDLQIVDLSGGLTVGTVGGINGLSITGGLAGDSIVVQTMNVLMQDVNNDWVIDVPGNLTISEPIEITSTDPAGVGDITLEAGVNPGNEDVLAGDLNLNANLSITNTTNSADNVIERGVITGTASGGFSYDPLNVGVIVETIRGSAGAEIIGRISSVAPVVHIPANGVPKTIDQSIWATIGPIQIDDVDGVNYRLNVNWIVGTDPGDGIDVQPAYQDRGNLLDGVSLLQEFDPDPNEWGTFVGNTIYVIQHEYQQDDFYRRWDTKDPAAVIPVLFTFSFDLRPGEANGETDSGIKFFRNGNEPVGIRVVVQETVELQPPAIPINIFPELEEDKPTVVYRAPEMRPPIINRSPESTAIELITPLGSVDIGPEEHLELWRVPASEIGELQVRIWADGDASALDDLPGLFRSLGNDHYRLYLVRGSRKVLLLDVLLRNGVPLPVVRPPDAGAANVPQSPADDQILPDPADQNAATAAEAASAIAVPVETPETETDPSADQASGEATAASAFAAAAWGQHRQLRWEERVDQSLRRFQGRSLSRLARIVRRRQT
ncbi:MAG: hypothetical protein KJ000_27905 [Pirellulaceae bacterium]|nr:hypothetical protein [Pirellulaceae bacterium]